MPQNKRVKVAIYVGNRRINTRRVILNKRPSECGTYQIGEIRFKDRLIPAYEYENGHWNANGKEQQ